MLVEVCANSLESALNAQTAGADRIELCSELGVGGITPSFGLLKSIKEKISIPVHVLIRPRSGDFTYSDHEFDIMKRNIRFCTDMDFDGIVSGVLNRDLSVDIERTKELVELTGNLRFTFHRAFDWVLDPQTSLIELESIGVDYILSSGQQKSALNGIALLSDLHHKTTNCTIIPGGGINSENVFQFKGKGFKIVHLSGTKYKRILEREPKISMNSPSFLVDDGIFVTSGGVIENVIKEVK